MSEETDTQRKQENNHNGDNFIFKRWISLFIAILVPLFLIALIWAIWKPEFTVFLSILIAYIVIVVLMLWPVFEKKE